MMKSITSLKKTLSLLSLLILGQVAAVAASKFYIENFSIAAGEEKEIAINLDNDATDITGFEGVIKLPAGLAINNNGYGNNTRAKANTSRINGMANYNPSTGLLKVMGMSTMKGTTGAVAYIKVTASTELAATSTIELTDFKVTHNKTAQEAAEAENATVTLTGGGSSEEPSDPSEYSVAFSLSESEVTMKAGETKTIDVLMTNKGTFTGLQAKLQLPEGIVVKDLAPNLGRLIPMGGGYDPATGNIAFIGEITGTEGALVSITIAPADGFTGTATIKVTDIVVTNSAAKTFKCDDMTLTVNVESSTEPEPVATTASFAFDKTELSLAAGESADVVVNMTNETGITGFQANMVLPAGITAEVTQGSRTEAAMIFQYNKDNDPQIVYFNTEAIAGNEGDVLKIKLTADETFKENGQVKMTAITLTGADSKTIKPADIVINITAAAPAELTFAQLVKKALDAVESGAATVTLDKDYVADAAVEVPLGKQLVIDGANFKLTMGEATNFVVNDNITLKNLKIDATALTKPLIALNATPAEGTKKNQEVYTDAATSDVNLLNAVTIDNVLVKNLKSNLLSSSKAAWAIVDFTLTNSIIQLNATGKHFIAMDGGGTTAIKNINIEGNTIYNLDATSDAYFIRYGNASNAAKVFGTNNGTSTFDYKINKNTLINTFKAKNWGNNTPNNKATAFTVTQNIFVDIPLVTKFVQGNCTKTVENNVTWGAAAESSIAETIEAAFETPTAELDLDAENGGINLTIGASTKAAQVQAGDPRWVVPFVAPEIDKTALENEITKANAMIPADADKTAEPEKTLAEAIVAAESAKEAAVFQEDVDKAVETLKAAENAYAKAGLTNEIAKANEMIPADADKTVEPAKALADAIAAAQAVADQTDPAPATTEELQAATEALKAAEEAYKTATGISTVKAAANEQNGAIYNLNGVRVTNPAKGVYIQNGKKVVIK